jgi:hypothetical protein
MRYAERMTANQSPETQTIEANIARIGQARRAIASIKSAIRTELGDRDKKLKNAEDAYYLRLNNAATGLDVGGEALSPDLEDLIDNPTSGY